MSTFVILPIVISVVVVVIVIGALKKSGAFGMSKAKRELAQQLMATPISGRNGNAGPRWQFVAGYASG